MHIFFNITINLITFENEIRYFDQAQDIFNTNILLFTASIITDRFQWVSLTTN